MKKELLCIALVLSFITMVGAAFQLNEEDILYMENLDQYHEDTQNNTNIQQKDKTINSTKNEVSNSTQETIINYTNILENNDTLINSNNTTYLNYSYDVSIINGTEPDGLVILQEV